MQQQWDHSSDIHLNAGILSSCKDAKNAVEMRANEDKDDE